MPGGAFRPSLRREKGRVACSNPALISVLLPVTLVRHLVDADGHREDERIILPRIDLHAVCIPDAEPFLRDLGDVTYAVFVIEDVALHVEVRPIVHIHGPALPYG